MALLKSLAKATLINTTTKVTIPVLFNPEKYTLSRQSQHAEVKPPGLESPLVQFVNGGAEKLQMELFFDTTENNRDVRIYTDLLGGLLMLDPKLDAPATLLFVWGSLTFPCVIEAISQNFTMFTPQGIPVRATVDVTFLRSNLIETLIALNPFRSLDHERKHIVRQGETLSGIAWEEYQDAGKWRLIAKRNQVADPRKLQPGHVLLIPPLA